MDHDFQQAEAVRSAKEQQQDRDDFNNEMAGFETGRMKRFGFDKVKQAETEQKEKAKRTLEDLLQDAAYKAAWEDATNAVNAAQDAVYKALIKAREDLALAEKDHAALMDRASTLPDGRRVFFDEHGNIYDTSGHEVPKEEQSHVKHRPNAPSWKDYQHSQDRVKDANHHYDDIAAKETRLQEINDTLHDDHPETVEQMQTLKQEATGIQDSVNTNYSKDVSYEVAKPLTQPLVAIDMKF